jgi:Arc/MetJ-type ribon-helix-helix transcriptional regulator
MFYKAVKRKTLMKTTHTGIRLDTSLLTEIDALIVNDPEFNGKHRSDVIRTAIADWLFVKRSTDCKTDCKTAAEALTDRAEIDRLNSRLNDFGGYIENLMDYCNTLTEYLHLNIGQIIDDYDGDKLLDVIDRFENLELDPEYRGVPPILYRLWRLEIMVSALTSERNNAKKLVEANSKFKKGFG